MKIKSSNGKIALAFSAAAAVWLGLSTTLFALKLAEGMEFGCAFLILGGFVVFGVLLALWAASQVLRWARFRESVLELDESGATLGSIVHAILHFGRPFQPTGPMTLNPRCIRHNIYRTSGREPSTRSEVTVLWRGECQVPLDASATCTALPVSFQIPSGYPLSDATPEDGGIRWQLEVLVPAKPVDFHTTFEFPVNR